MKIRFLPIYLTLFLALNACVQDDDDPATDDNTSGGTPTVTREGVDIPTTDAANVTTIQLDAAAEDTWKYVDLDTGTLVEESAESWDLGFQSTSIKLKGDNSNVAMALIEETEFDALETVPSSLTFHTDTDTSFAFKDTAAGLRWYLYEPDNNHHIKTLDKLYVVRTNTGAFFKFKMISYYWNEEETNSDAQRFPKFSFKLLTGDAGEINETDSTTTTSDTINVSSRLFFDVDTGTGVDANSAEWDISLYSFASTISVNTTSNVTIAKSDQAYDDITSVAESLTFIADTDFSNVDDNNPSKQALTWIGFGASGVVLEDKVFIIKTATDSFFKFQAIEYQTGGILTIKLDKL